MHERMAQTASHCVTHPSAFAAGCTTGRPAMACNVEFGSPGLYEVKVMYWLLGGTRWFKYDRD